MLACLAGTAPARAQIIETYLPEGVPGFDAAPGVTVRSRLHPETDPPGIRLGEFVLHPQASEGGGYDSNPAGVAGGGGGLGLQSGASALLASDWGRDALASFVSVDNSLYPTLRPQDQTDWTASLGGRLDIGRDALTLGFAHLSLHQTGTQIAALPTSAPLAYQVQDARASYALDLGRIAVTPSADFAAFRYATAEIQDQPVSQSYRDRDVLTAGLTASYELAPLRRILAVLRAVDSHYTAVTPGQPSPDGLGWAMLAGIDYDADALWRLRLLAGWEVRSFASAQYRTHTAPVAEGALTWQPSGLTTLTATLTRSIEDPAQEGQAGYTYTSLKLVVDHEYLRDVLLQASALGQSAVGLQSGGSQGGGTQTSMGATAGVTWLLGRNLRLSATYAVTTQRGPAAQTPAGPVGTSFTRQQLTLMLRFAL